MGPADLLKLSLVVQVALGGGYLAYLVAYAGIRQHHNATDVVFRTLAFGMVASAVAAWSTFIQPLKLPIAVAAAVAAGAFWRWKGMAWSTTLLRGGNVSWSDDIPTAWISLTATKTDCPVSQIVVDMTDGRTLICSDTRPFKDAPFGPCVLGLAGDVALYVTDEIRADGSWIDVERVIDEDGARVTYVPAAQIKRVELRHWSKKLSGSVWPEVEQQADEAVVPAASAGAQSSE